MVRPVVGPQRSEPQLVNIVAGTEDGAMVQDAKDKIGVIAEAALAKLPAGRRIRAGRRCALLSARGKLEAPPHKMIVR